MLTVLLATRNRARILRDVLETYCGLQPPGAGWKLVVVDNGSTDDTSEVIASFAGRLPLQSVVEPSVGKNCALNTGLPFVEGDLIVFSDDDVFPRSDWLVQLRKAADDHPAYTIFGGTILPRWEIPPPKWTQWIDQGPVYTITDPLQEEGPVSPDKVFGPNMAVRMSVFQSGTRLNPTIGPRGSDYPMGSETELVLRLGQQGYRAWHVQDAIVEHFIRKEQEEKPWVLQRATRWGRGLQRLSHDGLFDDVKLWRGIPRHLLRDVPLEALFMASAWLLLREKALFLSRWRFNILRGKALEARVLAKDRGTEAASSPTIGQIKS